MNAESSDPSAVKTARDANSAAPDAHDRREQVAAMEEFLQLTCNPGAALLADSSKPGSATVTSAGTEMNPAERHSHPASFPSIPGYDIQCELARGGMGVVYKAHHVRLNRPVAIKMILGGKYSDTAARIRFLIEAEAVARLDHPNIVGVYEFGQADDLPFFALEYVGGGTLANRIARDGKMGPRAAAALVAKLADALAVAHKKGIVHRDLKPANVLLTEEGEPKITDFGLAKVGQSDVTATGAVLGTPSYMSPEQAEGKTRQIGTETDVYALGTTLYELLVGRPPFKAENMITTIQQVIAREPDRLRSHDRAIPRDLETICLTCLEKEPRRRYPSAEALAGDLKAYLDNRSISARPVGSLERGWKWVQRNPAVSLLLGAVAATLVAGSITATAFALKAEHERSEAETARQRESDRAEAEAAAKRDAESAHQSAESARQTAESARQSADSARRSAQRQVIDLCVSSGMTAAKEQDHALALLWFARAARLAKDEPELETLNRIRIANWLRQISLPEGTFSIPNFRQNLDRFRQVQWSPDSRYLVVVATTGEHPRQKERRHACVVWDRVEARLAPLPLAASAATAADWQPETGLLAVAETDGPIRLLAPPEFKPVGEIAASGSIDALVFSGDGKRLAWGGTAGARVWDCETSSYLTPELIPGQAVVSLAFSSKGGLLATASLDYKARVFRVPSYADQPVFPPVPHIPIFDDVYIHGGPERYAPRFVAEDKYLLTVELAPNSNQDDPEKYRQVVWRSVQNGIPIAGILPADKKSVQAFATSTSGRHVALLAGDAGRLCDAASHTAVLPIPPPLPYAWNEDAVFSPDEKTLITCGHDTRVRFWSVEDRGGIGLTATHPPIYHTMQAVRVVPTSDGQHLAVGLWDGTVNLWRLPAGPPTASMTPSAGSTRSALSPDRRHILPRSTSYQNSTRLSTRVYDGETGARAGPPLAPGGIILDADFSPDGTRVATASSSTRASALRHQNFNRRDPGSGAIDVWDWKSGERVAGPFTTPTEPRGLAFHPNGRSLAVVCADYRIVLLNADTGEILHTLDHDDRPGGVLPNQWTTNGEARFSPDGRTLVTWETTNHMHVWDVERGQLRHTLALTERVQHVAFHPTDPNLLATSGWGNVVRIWNLATGKLVAALNHPQWAIRIEFSPDGTELVTGCDDGLLRVWDWKTEKLKEGWAVQSSTFRDFRFTADRRWLVTLSMDTLQVTDWRSKSAVTPRWDLRTGLNLTLEIPAGGVQAVVGGLSGSLTGYDLPTMTAAAEGPIDDLVGLAELAASRRILDGGNVVPLNRLEWDERWQRLKSTAAAAVAPIAVVPPWRAARAIYDRGLVLRAAGRPEAARAAFKEAVRLEPDFTDAHFFLGFTFKELGESDAAAAAYRDVIRLNPSHASAHNNLGVTLREQGDADGALAEFQEAVALQIDFAPSYTSLAQEWNQRDQPYRALVVLRDAARTHLAWMNDVDTWFRYNAACYAALAGMGQGKDAPPESARPDLRRQARVWLAADLAVWKTRAGMLANKSNVNAKMNQWLRDPDLAGVRDRDRVTALPSDERAEWDDFWRDVRQLRTITSVLVPAPPPRLRHE